MKYKKMPIAAHRDKDAPQVQEAIDWLLARGVNVRRPNNNAYQLKVSDDLSYYPAKGTILRDGDDAALPERGLEALFNLLQSESEITIDATLYRAGR